MPQITEDKLYDIFGVKPGENAQKVADSAENSKSAGANESEIAAPTVKAENATDDVDAHSEASYVDATSETKEENSNGNPSEIQDAETNAKFAAQRRAQKEKTNKILESERAKRADMLKKLSLKLSDGTVVESDEDLERYLAEHEAAESNADAHSDELNENNASTDSGENNTSTDNGENNTEGASLLSERLDAADGVKTLRNAINAAVAEKRSFTERAQGLEKTEARRAFLDDIASISYYDPNIKTPEDLDADPKIDEIRRYMSAGNSIKDSWKLAHFDDIVNKTSNKNSPRGLEHLSSPAKHSGDDVYISPEEAKQFSIFFPDISESEMRAAMRKFKK